MGQCSFLLTVLAFRCPLSVYSQIDIGCGIKIVAVFVSAKNTLSRHQPTNPDPGSVSTTSVQNKQPPAPNASNQNNQSTQTGVKKFSSPKRTPTRHSAAHSKKLVETCSTVQETNWDAQREKACVNLRLLVASQMLAPGSSKIFRSAGPTPNLDPKTGPKQRPKRRNENVIPNLDPILGSIFGRSAIGEFRCCPQMFCKHKA